MKRLIGSLLIILMLCIGGQTFAQPGSPIHTPSASTVVFTAASQAAMLALSAKVGDFCVRSDNSTTYILQTLPASTVGNWTSIISLPGGTALYARRMNAAGTAEEWADIRTIFRAKDYGAGTATLATISAGMTAISNSGEIYLNKGSWTIDDDLTIAAGVTLRIPQGAVLNIDTGKTVTFAARSRLDAGRYNIKSGSGSLVFAGGTVEAVFPEWWTTNTTPGTTDMAAAINAAVATGLPVKLAATNYGISTSINWSGTASFTGEGLGTIITPNAETFPAFVSTAALESHKEVGNFQINYGAATGNTKSTNANAIGFKITTGAGTTFPYMFRLHDVWISYANYAFKDSSISWGYNLERVYAYYCTYGFYKTLGTSVTLINCTTDNCTYGYYFDSVPSLSLINCSMGTATGTADIPGQAYFKTCLGLNINGFDIEGCTQSVTAQSILYLDNSHFAISGIRTYGNVLATGAAAEVSLIKAINGSWGTFVGGTVGSSDSYTGTGTAASLIVGGGAVTADDISVIGGTINVIATGVGGTNLSLKIAALSTITNVNGYIPTVTNAGLYNSFDRSGVKLSNTGTVTLTANAATTAVSNTLVTANSIIFLFPVTANAAADLGSATSVYISAKVAATSFTITHPNNANADKTFNYMIIN